MQPYYHSLQPLSLSGQQLDQLLALGWYRMHQEVFTTSHIQLGDIYKVHWLRYAMEELQPHTSHKRIYQRARNFQYQVKDFVLHEEHKALHHRYRSSIDFDGAPSIQDCLFGGEDMTHSIFHTKTISLYDGSQLIAAGYFDVGEKSAASILHFFDPAYARYSLGKYLILLTIAYLKEHNFHFYYPGYIVEGNPKMDYKLFLGKEQAQYFDPQAVSWKGLYETMRCNEPLSP